MKATQGVILLMFAALILWLTWSSNSPFKAAINNAAPKVIGTGGQTVTTSDPITGKPTAGGSTDTNISLVPQVFRKTYVDCIASGRLWNFQTNQCGVKQ